MHELVVRIREPELCYVFARNAITQGKEELAIQAYRHAVELRAAQHQTRNEAEEMALRAFYAYEEALSWQHKKRKRATGTWQMVNRHGILPTLQKRLTSKSVEDVLPALKTLRMEDYSFSHVARIYASELQQAA